MLWNQHKKKEAPVSEVGSEHAETWKEDLFSRTSTKSSIYGCKYCQCPCCYNVYKLRSFWTSFVHDLCRRLCAWTCFQFAQILSSKTRQNRLSPCTKTVIPCFDGARLSEPQQCQTCKVPKISLLLAISIICRVSADLRSELTTNSLRQKSSWICLRTLP